MAKAARPDAVAPEAIASAVEGDEYVDLTGWIGRSERSSDLITATPCAALAATLDRPAARPRSGAPLPALWHWLYFLPLAPQSELGADGHPRRGGFLPPVPLPRRMWAGSDFVFHKPLAIGDAIERTSTIVEVAEKRGRTGPLLFVRVRHEIRRSDETDVALTEFHDIVYREAAGPGEASPAPKVAPPGAAWERRWVPDPVLLFRYSALTFNTHRIHYDRRYATEVEGYPGLVVHGPLIATLLLDLLRRQMPDAEVARYDFRAMRPLFDLQPFDVCGAPRPDGKTFRLWTRDHEGFVTMEATASIR
jgi:3-methylfumaryl-CoA hydratase